jgi:uncharacterized protein YcbK (DUF882 family)
MGDLSANFSRHEFACLDNCGFDAISPRLINRLEVIRAHFDAIVDVDCGCRCPKHNAKVGGKPKSQHLDGIAADIKVRGVKPSDVAAFCEKTWPNEGGVGRYNTFTHVDVRPAVARWRG